MGWRAPSSSSIPSDPFKCCSEAGQASGSPRTIPSDSMAVGEQPQAEPV